MQEKNKKRNEAKEINENHNLSHIWFSFNKPKEEGRRKKSSKERKRLISPSSLSFFNPFFNYFLLYLLSYPSFLYKKVKRGGNIIEICFLFQLMIILGIPNVLQFPPSFKSFIYNLKDLLLFEIFIFTTWKNMEDTQQG